MTEPLRNTAIVELARALNGNDEPSEFDLRISARVVDSIAAHTIETFRALLEAERQLPVREFQVSPKGEATEVRK